MCVGTRSVYGSLLSFFAAQFFSVCFSLSRGALHLVVFEGIFPTFSSEFMLYVCICATCGLCDVGGVFFRDTGWCPKVPLLYYCRLHNR